ncbi:MAG: 6-phosphogluconolactonase [Rhodospirillaceae bacterium]|nr:6-phosphogluconolactonase [Rhodospirillaceae bacterium]
MSFTETRYDSRAALAAAVAARIADDLAAAIEKNGAAGLIVPGGTTPVAVFDALARMPLAWDKVTVLPCDERWVPRFHADSNEGLIHHHLQQGEAKAVNLLGLYRPLPTPGDAIAEIAASLRTIPRPFASVFLGMGEDGHFASLFPGHAETAPALDLNTDAAVMVLAEPAKGHPRIGLTLATLLDTPRILLAVTGAEKRIVLQRAIANINDDSLPIAALLRQTRTPVDILLSE